MKENKSYVYFAFSGDEFDPEIVTQAIGIEPSQTQKKGEKGSYIKASKFSYWKLQSNMVDNIFLENLILDLVSILYEKIDEINGVKEKFGLSSRIQVVMYIDTNEDVSTPALGHSEKVIEFLYKTNSTTDVDIYRFDSSSDT